MTAKQRLCTWLKHFLKNWPRHQFERRESFLRVSSFNYDGKTALYYAAQAENDDDALAIAKLLLKKCESDEHRSLLLFASAVGIGSAEKCLSSNSNINKFLESTSGEIMQAPRAENLLRVAASLGNADMTREQAWNSFEVRNG
ncbi:hypothetical protein SUGI_0439480 [Cryptomeria japonica]|nr:hypothetical protein SUGI_0439480 [Cryptomeria japonica]